MSAFTIIAFAIPICLTAFYLKTKQDNFKRNNTMRLEASKKMHNSNAKYTKDGVSPGYSVYKY